MKKFNSLLVSWQPLLQLYRRPLYTFADGTEDTIEIFYLADSNCQELVDVYSLMDTKVQHLINAATYIETYIIHACKNTKGISVSVSVHCNLSQWLNATACHRAIH